MLMMKRRAGAPAVVLTRQRQRSRGTRPDVALLLQAQKGDRGAYGQIVLLYQDRLYNAVVRLVGDREEARELTQEAFTRGLMKLDTFRGDASPYTWLFRIAVNLAISQFARCSANRVFSLDRPAGSGGREARPGRRHWWIASPATAPSRRPSGWSAANATKRCWPRSAGSTPNIVRCW